MLVDVNLPGVRLHAEHPVLVSSLMRLEGSAVWSLSSTFGHV